MVDKKPLLVDKRRLRGAQKQSTCKKIEKKFAITKRIGIFGQNTLNTMHKKTILLIIDPQNDFCDPKGALYVPNAEKDISRIGDMLVQHGDKIDEIIITADDHIPYDIAHPDFWFDRVGAHPTPFTTVTLQDINDGTYTTASADDLNTATKYIEQLEALGRTHTIWPRHCISGTWGADIDPALLTRIFDWMQGTSRRYRIVRKGWYPYSEHFGAFEAEIATPTEESTLFNAPLARTLNDYMQIFIAGEAKSHCVCNTIKQLMDKAPELVKKLVILDDAMSPVAGCDTAADDTIAAAQKLGAKVTTTTTVF
jgi:nicotinamidase-related amidase